MAGLNNADAETARVILSDIENKHFKHALTKVDKKLKKSDSDYFKALQLLIKAHLGQVSEKAAILLHLEELVLSKRILTDLNAIQIFDETLELILPKPGENWARIIGNLRWQLVKALPKDVDAGRACFRACLAKEDYEHARHIANSLEKNFPGTHEYVFWNITTMFLFSQCHDYPDKERTLYGALAEGMMRKLADATIKAADSSSLPTRSIHKVQEFRLMDTILKNGNPEKMNPVRLKYLQDPFLGPDSTIAKGEWQLWRLKLELLKKDPQLLFQTTSDLLKRARTKNENGEITESRFSDWIVWKSYIDSALLNKSIYQGEVDAEIKAHLDPKTGIDKSWRRNASLASLKFALAPVSAFPSNEPESKANLIVDYLQRYGDTNVAYTDLRTVIPFLTSQDLDWLLTTLIENSNESSEALPSQSQTKGTLSPLNQDTATAIGIARLVNVFKLVFLLTSSLPESQRRLSREQSLQGKKTMAKCSKCSTSLFDPYCGLCLTELAWTTAKSYGLAINDDGRITSTLLLTDLHPADDLGILAAMCLVKLSVKDTPAALNESLDHPAICHLLQAAVLLEYAWSHSKANSQISLMLTRIYYSLGCGSLALRAYKRLGVKQIQNATLSHYMFDGISTFHPHPFTSEETSESRSIIEDLKDQLKIYRGSPKQISNKIWSSFENNNYNTIFELEQVKKALAYNVSAVMSVMESRKVSRVVQPNAPLTASSHGYDILREFERLANKMAIANVNQATDIDDPEIKFSDQNDHETIPNFEVLEDESPLAYLGRASRLKMPLPDRLHNDILADKVRMIVDPTTDPVSRGSSRTWLDQSLSSIYEEGEEFYAIANILQGVQSFDKILQGQLTEKLNEIDILGSGSAPATRAVLHTLYVTYDIGTTVSRLKAYLHKTNSDIKSYSSLDLGEQLVKTVIAKAALIKHSLDEGGWIDKVLSSVFQGDVDVVVDDASVPGTWKSVVDENFMEAWAGQVVDSWKDSVKGFAYFNSQ
ncbi:N-terminal acetyltransferase B complex subunit arm1 [Hyphodiscus hymeniophilus]|uniref:N-terminal acetyltransferase B complex subunit arm1 n=1 Tax=Hyphodiscus hymeniophilus TaxID=353542 RepID=A0A9P6VM82_9HELO|nr:N-terminal acetyltransferase B complex subunit arm1 [Hyphodiscus hymeniophilus]